MNNNIKVNDLESCTQKQYENFIHTVLNTKSPPEKVFFKNIIDQVNHVLDNEDCELRPTAKNNLPGGLIDLRSFNKTIIIPDLHARRDFFKSLLFWRLDNNKTLLDLLENGDCTLLCLGDGVHAEGDLAKRWVLSYKEFLNGYKKHTIMDEEISDSFNLMIVIMSMKIRYKSRFNFLKGNHENILNETGNGNFSFAKFANEGAMVIDYFKKFYGNDIIKSYAAFEKKLPLFVVGSHFLASHAEPYFKFDRERIINYHNDSQLIEGLTWTENFSSEKGCIDALFETFLDNCHNCFYFGGHRPIKGFYNQINNDRFVQIHNPYKWIAVTISKDSEIILENDIVEVPQENDQTEISTIFDDNSNAIDFSEHFSKDE
ncbi:MAG: hypothetical protein A2015_03270 [Spirochaetes bacterium GWF1_31_7]|nr:MAG: hypothetical protein A2Y30_07355 [Spirochaetes bacterium GWE1_32_154]OHD50878.1 MAG: hypothetical protein A2015_03270 [Spirochaetes bacterium GWF1_31_7]OHD51865.1 MAG: hypothetical protein A2Y29_10450 [Spirochaetes bacterium GWE2_31_10]OHD76353.1 MAG: hypothetical protein A2355_06010 [Spirochaetes bacterium RIFOXYB1_FULL_32_8]HBD96411.1 hypothetical protein [Spirochaetia bacterium]